MEDFQQVGEEKISNNTVRKCPLCGSRSETIFQKEASALTYVLSLASLFIFSFWSIFIIPVIITATQMVTKRCYDCDTIIEKHNLFSLPSMSDQILNFRFGSFAFVVSRKYAYVILAILILGFIGIQLTKSETPLVEHQSSDTRCMKIYYQYFDKSEQVKQLIAINVILLNKSWLDFVFDCGSQVYIGNSVRANSHYQNIYHQNIIEWEGVYLDCQGCPHDLQLMKPGMEYSIVLKMNPTDSTSIDIILTVTYETNLKNILTLKELKMLDVVKFKGQFESLGNESQYHKLSLIDIQSTGGKINNINEIKSTQE